MPLESTAQAERVGNHEIPACPASGISNSDRAQSFLSALVTGVLLLSSSGALLLLGLVAWPIATTERAASPPLSWHGNALILIEGKGGTAAHSLEIQALSPSGWATVSSHPVSLAAASYPLLRCSLGGLHPDVQAEFVWRTADDPKMLHTAALPRSGDGEPVLSLVRYPAWKGTVIAFGIALHGTLRQPVAIEELKFMPMSASASLKALWSEWTAFEGWSGYSINFIWGGPIWAMATVRPVPAVAAWVGLALLLYAGWLALRRSPWDWRVAGTVFLIGWMVLDARWQLDLWRQLQETYHRYAGKTWEEKRSAAEDGPLFGFISRIKQKLPGGPRRIFLILDDTRSMARYVRIHASYHLLPHNVYAYATSLDGRWMHAGDYALIIGSVADVTYTPADKALRCGPNPPLPVQMIYSDTIGTLYKVAG